MAGNMIIKHAPAKFGPIATTVAGAAVATVATNKQIKTVGCGVAVIGLIGTLNQVSTPAAGGVQKGYQKVIAQVTPQLSGAGINGLAEVDMSEYDFEPYEGDIEGIDAEEAQALLEGGEDMYDDELEGEYDELNGLFGEESDVAELLSA